jgi:DNA-binding NarL/FixJ family response regulator
MAAGASAYISKTSEPVTVCETITTVARGGTYLAPEFHGALALGVSDRAAAVAEAMRRGLME